MRTRLFLVVMALWRLTTLAPAQLIQEALEDTEVGAAWIYHDYDKAVAQAKETGKPLFVLFRCVPCEACKVFDGKVVGQDSELAALYDAFVPVRIVRMNDVDLDLYQFDYDLSWAAFLQNADGTVYGRYGTRAAAASETHISIAGLKVALQRALELHAGYPANKALFDGKRGEPGEYRRPRDIPTLQQTVAEEDVRKGCVHCHMINDGFHRIAEEAGTWRNSDFFEHVYPLPESVGMAVDADTGNVVQAVFPGSAAHRAGIHAGDEIVTINGQAILSIADIQWVLFNAEAGSTVEVSAVRHGDGRTALLDVSGDWTASDISWRASMWPMRPSLGVWAPDLTDEERREMGLPTTTLARKVRWIPSEGLIEAGLRNGDIIVEMDGSTKRESHAEAETRVRMTYAEGDRVELVVWRDGERHTLDAPLD
ncbi:PDZ domain-containing protein [Candidatus Poribacteria bacterium]|nr:PDZ domain-containing protein [Candidatus Poribacteria bacterium]MBT7807959.1 PDZ domain-containing protein [Candidatus Poribacteria bacterium]